MSEPPNPSAEPHFFNGLPELEEPLPNDAVLLLASPGGVLGTLCDDDDDIGRDDDLGDTPFMDGLEGNGELFRKPVVVRGMNE